MGKEVTELRYLELKNELCRKIYEGVYRSGERIPSERQLALEYDMSRITVRKALDLLEEESLVVREVGNGTRVTLKNYGNQAVMDVIALVAPSKNPFFVKFIAEFQKCAWEHDSLLLYVEVPERTSLEDCLYRLYCKNIRNAVVWPDDQSIDQERLLRLRSIGMNLVFFDTDVAHPFADSVFLDNEDAVRSLLVAGESKERKCLYLGWDNVSISNIRKREEIFCRQCPDGKVLHLPWRRDRKIAEDAMEQAVQMIRQMKDVLVLCGTGEIGLQTAEAVFRDGKREVIIAVIDEFDGMELYPLLLYNQDLGAIAAEIFAQLERQAEEGAGWKAMVCPVRGQCYRNQPEEK